MVEGALPVRTRAAIDPATMLASSMVASQPPVIPLPISVSQVP